MRSDSSIHLILSVKNLGTYFDSQMLFDFHITEISKMVSCILKHNRINRIQDVLSKQARLTAVQTVALSQMNYAIPVWRTTNITWLSRVQKLQNFAARVVTCVVSKSDHVNSLLKEQQ